MQIFVDSSDERNKNLLKQLKAKVLDSNTVQEGDIIVFSPAKKWTKENLENLKNNITLFSGKIDESLKEVLKAKGIVHKNFMANPSFIIENSKLTSEAILALIISNTKKSIYENKILILGGGNLGTSLMVLLSKLGINFSLANYGEKRFYDAHHLTTNCFLGDEFKKHLSEFDVIVNTIPAEIFSSDDVKKIKKNTLFLETASKNCLSPDKHFTYILCPALPSKFKPVSAARLMTRYIKGEIL